mgnify:CR=1 FL=1
MSADWSRMLSRAAYYALIAGGVYAYLRYFEWRNLYYPARELQDTPADAGLEYEDVAFVAEDGVALHGWWIPCEKACGTVLHCHGNAGNIGDRVYLAADLHRLGVNVFLFDYRGYGRSRGIPTEQGTYRDARAAYEVVRARYRDAEDPPVIAHGQSLGGVVAIQLALDKRVRGVVVESVLPSTIELGARLYPWLPVRWFCGFRYDAISKAAKLGGPKLFAHSRDDEMIPYDLARKVFDAAPEPKRFVELAGGHNDAGWSATPEYWKALEEFVGEVLGRPEPSP